MLELLKSLKACPEAIDWLKPGETYAEAWARSGRGDWMLWLLAKQGVDRKRLVMAACECARLSLPYVQKGETRPLKAIETAEAWCRGEATLKQVNAAAHAADAATYAATYAACDATWAAAYAADAAANAANAANAAHAAYADVVAHAAYTAVPQQCAGIVREHFPQGANEVNDD